MVNMIKKFFMTFMYIAILFIVSSCMVVEEDNHIDDTEISYDVGTYERLFDDVMFRKITIEITRDNWELMNDYMFDQYQKYGILKTNQYVVAQMIYEDEIGQLEIENIGIRPRGNTSLTTLMDEEGNINMNHFKLSFKEDFDGTYPNNDGRRGFELKELNLKWNVNQDETHMTEAYGFDFMNQYGVYAPQTSHVVLVLNIDGVETVMGLYTAFEPIDDEFIERRLDKKENDGNLYKCLWQQNGPATLEKTMDMRAFGIKDVLNNYFPSYDLKTNKDESNHEPFRTFINHINDYHDELFVLYIDENFDVEMFLKLLAVNVFFGNPDDYRAMGNNYYMYQNSKTGKWMMIPYDFDHGLGQGWMETGVYQNYTIGVDIIDWVDINDYLTGDTSNEILVDKILSQEKYLRQYITYIEEILNDSYFTETHFLATYEALRQAFDGTYNQAIDNQSFGLRGVIQYINDKRDDVENQLISFS